MGISELYFVPDFTKLVQKEKENATKSNGPKLEVWKWVILGPSYQGFFGFEPKLTQIVEAPYGGWSFL